MTKQYIKVAEMSAGHEGIMALAERLVPAYQAEHWTWSNYPDKGSVPSIDRIGSTLGFLMAECLDDGSYSTGGLWVEKRAGIYIIGAHKRLAVHLDSKAVA